MVSRSSQLAVLSCLLLSGSGVVAQDINASNIDFFTGPLVSSSRVVGLGGAYTGIGEGAAGHLINPASYAMRFVYEADDKWAYDFDFSVLNDGVADDNALDLSGRRGVYDAASFGQSGFDVKWDRYGGGVHVQYQTYTLNIQNDDGTTQTFVYDQRLASLGLAHNFKKGELVLGMAIIAGAAVWSGEVEEGEQGRLEMAGAGLHFGLLWVRPDKPYRLGLSFRGPIKLTQDGAASFSGDTVSDFGDRVVPEAVVIPAELSVGMSYVFGPRPNNVSPTFGRWLIRGEEKPVRLEERRYILVSSDLVFTGATEAGIGVQSYLERDVQPSGEVLTISPRLGVESEFWEDVMVGRLGTYVEPSRFDPSDFRVHATGGLDLHLSFLWEWRLGLTFDFAQDYSNFGLGLGFWH